MQHVRIGRQVCRKLKFYRHALTYVAVNLLFLTIDLLTSPGTYWFFYPLLGWGIGLTAHGLSARGVNWESCMKVRILPTISLWFASVLLALPALGGNVYGVGYQERRFSFGIHDETLVTSLWYPTGMEDKTFRVGPYTLAGNRSVPLAQGQFGLIVLSHGTGGGRFNQRGLAGLLAQRGFVVAALDHAGDYWRDTQHSGTRANWYRRPRQISRVIDGILADKIIGPHIDRSKIGAVGHSIGGYTILALIGALPEPDLVETHCVTRRHLDPEFCAYGKPQPPGTNKTPQKPDLRDERISVAVAVAPVGVIFGENSFTDVTAKVAVHRFGKDTILRYPWHSENIINLLSDRKPTYRLHPDAHHFAFIEPFPSFIREEVGLPAYDPPGFNRSQFLGRINEEITAFLTQYLLN